MSSTDEARIDALLSDLARGQAGNLSEVMRNYFGKSTGEVKVSSHRGLAMISVADVGLEPFEHDRTLKSYADSNHMFADLLVPVGPSVSVPILFWLSLSNSPGVSVALLRNPKVYVVSLGKPYAFADVCANISNVLGKQGVTVKYKWFAKTIGNHGLDPTDPAFRNLVGE
jgi:hypothetical protein